VGLFWYRQGMPRRACVKRVLAGGVCAESKRRRVCGDDLGWCDDSVVAWDLVTLPSLSDGAFALTCVDTFPCGLCCGGGDVVDANVLGEYVLSGEDTLADVLERELDALDEESGVVLHERGMLRAFWRAINWKHSLLRRGCARALGTLVEPAAGTLFSSLDGLDRKQWNLFVATVQTDVGRALSEKTQTWRSLPFQNLSYFKSKRNTSLKHNFFVLEHCTQPMPACGDRRGACEVEVSVETRQRRLRYCRFVRESQLGVWRDGLSYVSRAASGGGPSHGEYVLVPQLVCEVPDVDAAGRVYAAELLVRSGFFRLNSWKVAAST
jgi:hypothetical protein